MVPAVGSFPFPVEVVVAAAGSARKVAARSSGRLVVVPVADSVSFPVEVVVAAAGSSRAVVVTYLLSYLLTYLLTYLQCYASFKPHVFRVFTSLLRPPLRRLGRIWTLAALR